MAFSNSNWDCQYWFKCILITDLGQCFKRISFLSRFKRDLLSKHRAFQCKYVRRNSMHFKLHYKRLYTMKLSETKLGLHLSSFLPTQFMQKITVLMYLSNYCVIKVKFMSQLAQFETWKHSYILMSSRIKFWRRNALDSI